ncbi:MAG: DUF4174 domain-containing protein [Rubrobacteraceae bacterium]|nr:DUF4174 domain-containing protein [Rubrobacter sp.]
MDLKRHRGTHRLLLIFAPSASNRRYGEQKRLLAAQESGFEDRDLLLVRFFDVGTDEADGAAANEPASAEAAEYARREYGVEAGRFAVALVGKDGGVKFRADEPVPAREIFDRIDAMPMRRREMREKDSGRE